MTLEKRLALLILFLVVAITAITQIGCAGKAKKGSFVYCSKQCRDKFGETFVWHTGPYRDCMDQCRTPWWDR